MAAISFISTSYFLRNVCLLLYTLNERLVQQGYAEEQFTLLDINPLLQYEDYATLVLNQLDMSETWHQELLAWWKNTYFTLPRNSSFRQEVILPILSKMGVFNNNQQLRRIVGQPVTRAPIHEAVTAGKIVLCTLSSRDMDDAAVNILGSTLINLLRRSFRLQEAVPLQERRKVFLAIDEFQAFSGADIGKLLSEDAKFGCAALLATQFLKQLNTFREGLLDTVLGNCENLQARGQGHDRQPATPGRRRATRGAITRGRTACHSFCPEPQRIAVGFRATERPAW